MAGHELRRADWTRGHAFIMVRSVIMRDVTMVGLLIVPACGGRILLDHSGDFSYDGGMGGFEGDGVAADQDAAVGDDAAVGGTDSASVLTDGTAPGPPTSNALFSSACAGFAAASGRISCESCLRQVNCDALWQSLETQCGPAYRCGVANCLCTSPCNTVGLCACLAGCLPVEDNPCTQLWAQAMQCATSHCGGGC